jgi:hypothetical protein
MLKFSKFTLFFSLAVLLLTAACRKGEAVEEFYFGSMEAQLLGLPGATTLDVYVDGHQVDTLAPGLIVGRQTPIMLNADKSTKIEFKKKGTDSLVLDTTIAAGAGKTVGLSIAFSTILGIKTFTNANDAHVAADSTSFFLYNGIPTEAIAEDVELDAVLFRFNKELGDFEETGIVWNDMPRGKLHTQMVTVRILDDENFTIYYGVKLRDKATGQYIMDGIGQEMISLAPDAGKRGIVTLSGLDLGGIYMFLYEYAVY